MHSPWKTIFLLLVTLAIVAFARIGRPGGRFPITDLNNQGLQSAASFAIMQLEAQSNRNVRLSIARIISAEYQVVAGMNYFFSAAVRVTKVSKPSNPSTTTCNFSVFRSLRGEYSLTSHRCANRGLFN